MFDYEYEYEDYYEPSELDEALDEFKDGLRKHLNKAISDELQTLTSSVESKQKTIDAQCTKINELQKQLRDTDSAEKQKEIDRITGNIKVGQKVFTNIRQSVKHDCEDCVSGEITVAKPNKTVVKMKCPTCNGRGYNLKTENIIKETAVASISLRAEATKYGISIRNDDRYYYVPDVKNYVTVYLSEEDAKNKRNGIGRQYWWNHSFIERGTLFMKTWLQVLEENYDYVTYQKWLKSELDIPIKDVFDYEYFEWNLAGDSVQFKVEAMNRAFRLLFEEVFPSQAHRRIIKNGLGKFYNTLVKISAIYVIMHLIALIIIIMIKWWFRLDWRIYEVNRQYKD